MDQTTGHIHIKFLHPLWIVPVTMKTLNFNITNLSQRGRVRTPTRVIRASAYSAVAFNERVTFWLQWPGHSCVRMLHYCFLCMQLVYNHLPNRTCIQHSKHRRKAVIGRVETKRLHSCRRQSDCKAIGGSVQELHNLPNIQHSLQRTCRF